MANLQGTVDGAPPKLLDSLKSYAGSWVSLLKTRFEIISTELEEERERLRQIVVLSLISAFFLTVGTMVLTILVVAFFWEQRVAVLAGFTALYLCLGAGIGLAARHKIRNRPKLFSTTIAELSKDQRHLSS